MSWLSFDDGYTRQAVWDGMSYEARWMHHAIVERCCNERRYDGMLPWTAALRCSDVPEPMEAINALISAGLIADHGSEIEAVYIEDFLPPEGQRPEVLLPRKRANQAKWRRDRCRQGTHDKDCPPKTCPVKIAAKAARESAVPGDSPGDSSRVTGRVTGNVASYAGSGRGGSGSPKTEGQGTTHDGEIASAAKPVTGGEADRSSTAPQSEKSTQITTPRNQPSPDDQQNRATTMQDASLQTVTRASEPDWFTPRPADRAGAVP